MSIKRILALTLALTVLNSHTIAYAIQEQVEEIPSSGERSEVVDKLNEETIAEELTQSGVDGVKQDETYGLGEGNSAEYLEEDDKLEEKIDYPLDEGKSEESIEETEESLGESEETEEDKSIEESELGESVESGEESNEELEKSEDKSSEEGEESSDKSENSTFIEDTPSNVEQTPIEDPIQVDDSNKEDLIDTPSEVEGSIEENTDKSSAENKEGISGDEGVKGEIGDVKDNIKENPDISIDNTLKEETQEDPIIVPISDEEIIDNYNLTDPTYADDNGNIRFTPGKTIDLFFPEYITGNTVESIGANSFIGNDVFRVVIIPSCITQIGDNAFDECPYLELIILRDRVDGEGIELGENWNGGADVVYVANESNTFIDENLTSDEIKAPEEIEAPIVNDDEMIKNVDVEGDLEEGTPIIDKDIIDDGQVQEVENEQNRETEDDQNQEDGSKEKEETPITDDSGLISEEGKIQEDANIPEESDIPPDEELEPEKLPSIEDSGMPPNKDITSDTEPTKDEGTKSKELSEEITSDAK